MSEQKRQRQKRIRKIMFSENLPYEAAKRKYIQIVTEARQQERLEYKAKQDVDRIIRASD